MPTRKDAYMSPTLLPCIATFLCGILIGGFMDAWIRRLLKKENKTVARPLLLGALNGSLYLLTLWRYGPGVDCLLYCLLFGALAVLGIIDLETYEIPPGANLFILALGLARVATDMPHWLSYGLGFFSASVPLLLIYIATRGRGIGGGDIKLMAATGLLLGWETNLLGLFLGCALGLAAHALRMKMAAMKPHLAMKPYLAMGPYLAVGIALSVLWGEWLLAWLG